MLRFVDPGGRIYSVVGTSGANLLAHWTSSASISNWSIFASGGRVSGTCLRIANNNAGLIKTLDAQQTWGIALAFKPVDGFLVSPFTIIEILDAGNSQIDLRMNGDGTFSITRGGTVLGTSSFSTTYNKWNHLELKVKIDPSVGTYDLWINGVNKISGTGANTRATANSTGNQIRVGNSTVSFSAADYDDIIIYDGQTTDAAGNADITGPVGDCGITVTTPTGAGTTTQFTPDSGSNYARVNEASPDITSYVESSTVSQKDTYAVTDLAGTITSVKAIATLHYARKTDVGSRQMGAVIRTNSTDYTHATGIDLTDSYLYYMRNWGSNPNTTVAWTTSDINALEGGQVVNT